MRRLGLLLLLTSLPVAATAGPRYAAAEILAWPAHSFRGETDYRLVSGPLGPVVEARCTAASASGRFLRTRIDLRRTPILEWRWRVDAVYEGLDETRREGDDYPARLYVVDEHRLAIWRTRALNYVWASRQPAGSDWPNAYTAQAHMIAVRSGAPESPGFWRTERRNVREDFRRYHGEDRQQITTVAIMTDCDNAAQTATAWYGEIRFLAEEAP